MPHILKQLQKVPNSLTKGAAETFTELFVSHRCVVPARGAEYLRMISAGPGLHQLSQMTWDELTQEHRSRVQNALRDFVRLLAAGSTEEKPANLPESGLQSIAQQARSLTA